MDSVQMWELYGQLTWKGEGEFRAKLMEMSRLVEQVQRQINNLGTGGGAGGIGASGPGSTPLRPNFLYGGGVGGAPTPEARMPPPLPPPPPPAGTNTATPQTPDSPPPSGGGKQFNPPTGAELVARSNAKAAAALPGKSTIGAISYPDYSWYEAEQANAARRSAAPGPISASRMLPNAGESEAAEAAAQAAARVGAPGPIPASRLLKNADEVAAEQEAGQKKFNIPGLHYPALRERVSGGLMGGELVGIGARKLAAELAETGKKSKTAGDTIAQLGLRHAWIIRSATAGGPLGMLGGAMGAGIGLAMGNAGFGALMGNMLGQMTTSGIGRMHGAVGQFSPGTAMRFERAQADLSASFGEILVPSMEKTTKITRQFADVISSNKSGLGWAIDKTFDIIQKVTPGLRILDYFANQPGVPGAAQGKAISPLGGHVFGGPDELYRAVAAMTMMYSDQGPQQAEMKATIPGSAVPLTNPKPPGREGHIGAMMDAIWINPLTGTMIT